MEALIQSRPIDVLLAVGVKRLAPAVFDSATLKLVIWVTHSGVQHPLPRTPPDFSVVSLQILHSDLGGVTDGTFRALVYQRQSVPVSFRWNAVRVSNTLQQILDPTISGRKVPRATFGEGILNSPLGLLQWSKRRGRIYAPSVFGSDFWIHRVLTNKELANALDVPADALASIEADGGRCLSQLAVPGKILGQLVQGIHDDRWGDFATFAAAASVHEAKKRNEMAPAAAQGAKKRKETEEESAEEAIPRDEEEEEREEENSQEPAKGLATGYDLVCGNAETVVSAKATKSDDTEVPVKLWDQAVIDGLGWLRKDLMQPGSILLGYRLKRVLKNMRKWTLRIWKTKVRMELERWMEEYGPSLPDERQAREKVTQILKHVEEASWWNWDGGSSLFFWRWPLSYMGDALYGVKPMFVGKPPNYWVPQPPIKDERQRTLVRKKIKKVMERGYLVPTRRDKVRSLMFVFDVPKGENDIRMVYDGSKSGLNDALWAPWFPLPTAESFFDVLMPGYWLSDNDMGDFFLNFPMHQSLQSYCGVDVSELFPDESRKEMMIVMWLRAAMGLTNSPHLTTMQAGVSDRLILGDRTEKGNPFEWERVVENLPGTPSYDGRFPWIYKVRKDGRLAGDTRRFMDDLRNSAPTRRLAWEASTRIGKVTSWLGQQDAPRKRRPPSQTPGAWAATVVSTINNEVMKFVTQEAWNKAKQRVLWLAYYTGCQVDRKEVDTKLEQELKLQPKEEKGFLIHKIAEKYRGYLVHISATYEAIVPYLKGLHLTLDSWREGRDEEGWKDLTWYKFHRAEQQSYQTKAPKWVKAVPRMKGDMEVLLDFFSEENPPKVPIRPTSVATMYIVGDASGTGYGNTSWGPQEEAIAAQYGGWENDVQRESSNYREAYTAVIGLEDSAKKGKLKKGCEVFIVTDNFITERVFENGSSKSKKLHDLVVRLRKLEMQGYIFVRVIWVAGTRMIRQGTDSLSRGDLCSGVMAGDPFLDHIPLSQGVADLHQNLIPWIMKELPGDWNPLSAEGWFESAFEDPEGCFIWTPPPATARHAIDLLSEAHHVHPFSSHIVLIPSIMTGKWRKRLAKCSDVLWVLKPGSYLWPAHLHEPLTLAFVAPQQRSQPWRMGRSKWLEERNTGLQRLLSADPRSAGRGLRQFWNEAFRRKGGMPKCLAPTVLQTGSGRWIPCPGGPRFGGFDH